MNIMDVSIPFEQGDVFRLSCRDGLATDGCVSIPFEQGDVFRLRQAQTLEKGSLNPFRAGRCLSTYRIGESKNILTCLNPFRAGRCLST